jgi:hypothetical protein
MQHIPTASGDRTFHLVGANRMDPVHISRPEDWSRVNEMLEDFEDGSVKELRFDSSNWLDSDDSLRYGEGGELQVVVQLQSSAVSSALLSFRGVVRFEVDQSLEVCPAIARALSPSSWRVEFLSCIVEAETCFLTPTGDRYVGAGPFVQLTES